MQTPQGKTAAPSPDDVTFVVFKENHSARTFNISLRWLSRLGILGGLLIAISCISLVFALKFKFDLRRMDPSHVQKLEQEVADLKSSYQALEAKKLTAGPASVATVAPRPAESNTPSPKAAQDAQTAPAPTPHAAGNGFVLGSVLPTGALPAKDPASLPITIESLKIQWNGKTLRTRFNIHYSATDGGTQEGTIMIIARGPKTILGYPAGIFGEAESPSLVVPSQGEHFSVSRFRQVNADFGPLSSTDSLKTVEILIFNDEGQLIYQQTAHPEIKATRAAPVKPVEKAPPAAEPVKSAEQAPAAPAPSAAAPATPTSEQP